MRVVLVLTQDRGGPADLSVSLALELTRRGDGPDVRIVGPPPVTSAGDAGHLLHPVTVSSKRDARGAIDLRRVLDALRPDIVHAQDRRAALMVATVARGRARVVSTYHGLPNTAAGAFVGCGPLAGRPPTPRSAALLVADAAVTRAVSLTVAPSRAMARFLRERLRLPAARLHVIPNGVEVPAAQRSAAPVRTFLSVTSFSPEKATPLLVRAFAQVAGSGSDVRLLLVGDGPERSECEGIASRLGVSDRVEFTGYRVDVPVQLAAGDAFVLSSVNENLPLALLQAMAYGMPCVATRVGGVPEALGSAGLLVRPGDHRALAAAMSRLVDAPGLASDLGRRAVERVRGRFSLTACADRHAELWDRVRRPAA